MSKLQEKLERGEKVFTAEIAPPKGAGIKKLMERANHLSTGVDAINITDCQRALVRMSSLAASKLLLESGFEPVFQLTCRDRNSIAIQSDLMGAAALKIPNLLCLTGDPVKVGDSPKSKSVFEMETLGLLRLVDKLANGVDGEGHKLNAKAKFYVGAVVNPTLKNNSQLERMKKKIELGAKFFQTQANYDLEDLEAFLKESRQLNTKVITGILLLHSYEMAKYIHEHIPGIHMPDFVLKRFEKAKEEGKELESAIEFAVLTMKRVEQWCDGFHLMSIRAEEHIPEILEKYHGFKTNPSL